MLWVFAVWEDAWYKKTNLALAQAGGPPVFTESTGSAIPVVNGCLVQQGGGRVFYIKILARPSYILENAYKPSENLVAQG